jgi:hypothetical protein
MKKLQTICAAILLVLAFGIPALADDGIMGTGDKLPQPPPTTSTVVNPTETPAQTSDDDAAMTFVQEAELYVVRGLAALL